MSDLANVCFFVVKEMVNPNLHHKNATELFDDVEQDCFHKTHSFGHMKYVNNLREFVLDRQGRKQEKKQKGGGKYVEEN